MGKTTDIYRVSRRKQTVGLGRGMEGFGEVARGFEGQEVLVSICVSRWREGILDMSKHVLGVASSETAGLGSEVQEDGIRFPLAQCPDGCLVNTGDKQGGCTSRVEAIGFDLVGGECW